jgi:uncharacterized protein
MVTIKHIHERIKTKLIRVNRFVFILTIVGALLLIKYLFIYIYKFIEVFDIVLYPFPINAGKIRIFFIIIFIAPVVETWIAQSIPYTFLNKVRYLKERSYLILLISALFFGLNHFYSLFYMVYGFLIGIVFMYGYMVRIKTDDKTFYLIAICHSLGNLVIFISRFF